MERTLVEVLGYGGGGGYGILSSTTTIPCSLVVARSALPQHCHPIVFTSRPRQLRPLDCRSSEVSHSVSISSGFPYPRLGGDRNKISRVQRRMADTTTEAPASGEQVPVTTMKVVDHLVLFKMNVDELQEKEMLDGLYSLQYAIKDIICSTLGRLTATTPYGYTHGLFTRFKSVKALNDYLTHEKKVEVADQLIIPFFSEDPGLCMTDFETEVENNLEAVFRRGDRFESGVEHFLMFKFKEGTTPEVVEETLNILKSLHGKFGDGIVQTTMGVNIEPRTTAFLTHGVAIRFESESSYYEFEKFLGNEPTWAAVKNVIENQIEGGYVVEPIGNKLM